MKVLSFGEILWDVIEGNHHLGGAPFNFAAHAAQCGNQSYIISRLGKDKLGKEAHELCKGYGVNDSFIQWDEKHPTGVVDVTLEAGQPDYYIHENVAWDFIEYDSSLSTIGQIFDVFYFGSLAQRHYVSADTLYKILTQNKFKHIFYDVNLRKKGYSDEILKRSLGHCTILKLNNAEVPVLSQLLMGTSLDDESFCKRLLELHKNITAVIITAAEKGCYIFENDNLTLVPGVEVKVADAVGAGDSFSAAFMHGYVASGDALKAAKVANQIGAFVASKHGAIPEYSEEIKNILATL
jgi:fructokinase